MLSALVAGAVTMAGLGAAAPNPPAPEAVVARDEAAALPAGSAAKAAADARRTKRQAEVAAERGETRTVYANPDGSFTAEFTTVPTRVRRGERWLPVDTTLARHGDGRYAPQASAVEVSFSGGGTGPAVRLVEGDARVELTWTGGLPRPVVSRDSATYREVLPGVDLRLTATSRGFSKVFVVKSRKAAVDPRLAALRLGVAVRGATLRTDRHGNAAAYDRAGNAVFHAGAPLMWDSTTPEPRRALGELRWGSGGVTLRPDRALLAGAGVRYPVYVDPDFQAGQAGWAMVFSGKPGNAYWGGDGDDIAKVGYCGWSYCNGIGTVRSYFQYNAAAMVGKELISAEFNAYESYAPSCTARVVEAYGTAPIHSLMTWSKDQPYPGGDPKFLGSHNVAYGYSSNCTARWLGFNALEAVRKGVTSHGGTVAILLKAAGEGDSLAWKKFGTTPKLTVTYNTKPDVAAALTAENQACATAPNQPYVNPYVDGDPAKGPRGPSLAATVTDPEGGLVHAQFEWWSGGVRLGVQGTVEKASGSRFSVDVPAAHAVDGGTLSYRARGADGRVFGDWSGWCDVTVDRTSPATVPTVGSATYPECPPPYGSCPSGGGAGTTAGFTFTPNGESNVAGYRYDLHDQPSTYVAANAQGVATGLVTPPTEGTHDLYVASVDRAGNVGPAYRYHFRAGTGSPPVGYWRLQGLNETVARDDTSHRRHGTVTLGPTTWRTGRHGDGLWFNGSSGQVTAGTTPTVDTSKTFSISAWLKPDRVGTWQTGVSQDGTRTSAFYLQVTPQGYWTFAMATADVDGGGSIHRVVADQPAVVGAWTHVVATYDTGRGELRLYVNGRLAGTGAHSGAWAGTRPLVLGRSMWNGGPSDFWPGTIDEVRAYQRALSPTEIYHLAVQPATEVAFFGLDEPSGPLVDSAGSYHVGTPGAGVTRVPGEVGTGAVQLDGTGAGNITTAGPVVRTDNSFTVTAWVKLDLDGYTGARTAVAQDGNRASGFYLSHREGEGWTFLLLDHDADNPGGTKVTAPAPTDESGWVHLAGVYDAAAREIRLYVGGELVGFRPYTAQRWHAAGAFTIGRAKWNGMAVDAWKGSVDDVHVWTGVRSEVELQSEAATPVTSRITAYSGQLSRWWNYGNYHVATTGAVPPGSHFEGPMGLPAPTGAADTRVIYSCRLGTSDYFLSGSSTCEGYTRIGTAGSLYISPPAGVPVVAVYRCNRPGIAHFVSHDPNCEGATAEGLLGYARAYAYLIRYVRPSADADHATSVFGVGSDYHPEGTNPLGLVGVWQQPGTTALVVCRDGEDTFSSTDPGCEGRTVVRTSGFIWASPPSGVAASAPLYRCATSTGERFDRLSNCTGHTLDRVLGYVVTRL